MLKKILIGVAAVVLLAAAGLFFWARAILASDAVRTTLAAQLTEAVGHKVAIGGIDAGFYPRISVNLEGVAIGEPARITVKTLKIATGLRGLLSRRIERATVRLEGARIELPLPDFAFASAPSAGDAPSGAPVEIVSVEEIILSDVEVVSGGRVLRGDIEASLEGQRVALRKVALSADGTAINASGTISDPAGPVGDLKVTAGTLSFDDLLAFVADFSSGIAQSEASASSAAGRKRGTPPPSAMRMTVTIDAERATMGLLAIEKLSGQAVMTGESVSMSPLSFGLFGGKYEGDLSVKLAGDAPAFHWKAALSGIDMGAATRFAGSPDTITGRLAGKIDLTGEGVDAASAIRTARGTARVDVTDGIIKNLGLLRNVVTATSMRSSPQGARGSADEPFSRLGATLAIARGSASTRDLLFVSENLRLSASGAVRLDGSAIDLAGRVQLSEALTKQAGHDLVRYTQEEGRVTLPATITGAAAAPIVRIDAADMAKRAIRNRAKEEAQGAIKKGLGGLFKR